MQRVTAALCVSASLLIPAAVRADVKLPPVLSSHMVLQRDVAAPIWGTADPGEEVTVSVTGQMKKTAVAGQTKKTTADAMGRWKVALDPLTVSGEALTLTVKGKNELTLTDILVGDVWLGSGQSNMAGGVRGYAPNDEGLQKILAAAPYPKIRLISQGGKGWQLATPESVPGYSAILFSFGAKLQAELDVPIGLMQGAVGGTPSGYWLTEDMLRADAPCREQAAAFAKTYDHDAAVAQYEKQLAAFNEAQAKAKAEGKPAPKMATPKKPAKAGESTGVIGHLYKAHVLPYAPFAIRGVLWDQGESGTAITGVDQYHVMGALIKGWRQEWGQDFPFLYVQKASGGGTAWDLEDPITKNASKFAPLPKQAPAAGLGLNREMHIKIQQHPNTAMVIATDLGSGVHPTNKSGYGARAARTALGFAYKKPVEFSGPLYASHAVEGNKIRIKFTHIGQGLAARHAETLQGFELAGADKAYHWADAVIDGDTVVVSSKAVPEPVAARYAWSNDAPWANLFNKDGLPAQTFRTDEGK